MHVVSLTVINYYYNTTGWLVLKKSLLTSLVALLDEPLEMQLRFYLPPHFSYAVKMNLDHHFP